MNEAELPSPQFIVLNHLWIRSICKFLSLESQTFLVSMYSFRNSYYLETGCQELIRKFSSVFHSVFPFFVFWLHLLRDFANVTLQCFISFSQIQLVFFFKSYFYFSRAFLLLFSEYFFLIVSCSCFIHTQYHLILWFPSLKSFHSKIIFFVLFHLGEQFSSWAVSHFFSWSVYYIYKTLKKTKEGLPFNIQSFISQVAFIVAHFP